MTVDLKTLKIRQLVKRNTGGGPYPVTAVGVKAFLYTDGFGEHVVYRMQDWEVYEPPAVGLDKERVYVLLSDGTLANEGIAWRGTNNPRVRITGYEVVNGAVK